MKRISSIALVVFLSLCFLFSSNAYAEKSTLYDFPEFSVRISDNYLTFTKENVEDVVGSNTLFGDMGFFLDFFELDNTLYLEAVNYQTFDEICIRFQENSSGMDFRFFNNFDDDTLERLSQGAKEAFEANGFVCQSAQIYRHPQIVFTVLEGDYPGEQGYTIIYSTVVKANNRFYTITVVGISSSKEKSEELATDLQYTVSSLDIEGYPDFEFTDTSSVPERYRSEFKLLDGEHFGDSYEEVLKYESQFNTVKGSVYEPPAWSNAWAPTDYSKSLTYYNISYLDIDYSSKSFLFDENDILFSAFYEFRSGYYLNLEGQDKIDNFAPSYNAVELYLRDLYGNPHYQMKKGTKCEIDGHGMLEAIYLLDGSENERLYDYSEWLLDDPEGKIKIEHIMYFTGYIYKHNVSVEIIRHSIETKADNDSISDFIYPKLDISKVYYIPGEDTYHSVKSCDTLVNKKTLYMSSLDFSVSPKLGPCRKCVDPNQIP